MSITEYKQIRADLNMFWIRLGQIKGDCRALVGVCALLRAVECEKWLLHRP